MRKYILFVLIVVLSISPAFTAESYADIRESRIRVALKRAQVFAEYRWSPLHNVYGWKQRYVMYAGGNYTVPYAQSYSGNGRYVGIAMSLREFTANVAVSSSPIYSGYTNAAGIAMPVFGTDCSGFVSYILGIDRLTTVGFREKAEEGKSFYYVSYSGISAGDLLNLSGSHVLFVAGVNNGVITTYEQTPNGGLDTVVRERNAEYFRDRGYKVIRYAYPNEIALPEGAEQEEAEDGEDSGEAGDGEESAGGENAGEETDIPDSDGETEENGDSAAGDEVGTESESGILTKFGQEIIMIFFGIIVALLIKTKIR